MPEKHHAVKNEKYNHPKGKVGKPNGGICEIVNMEKAKEKEEDSRKVRDTVKAAKAGIQDTVNESIWSSMTATTQVSLPHHCENLNKPNNAHEKKGQKSITFVEFNKKEEFAHHQWTEDQGIQHMCCHQEVDWKISSNSSAELFCELEHPLLRFIESKAHKCRAEEE